MNKVCVYRHLDNDGVVLYIGSSANPAMRLRQHMVASPWAGFIAEIRVQWFADRQAALEAEARAIFAESPQYNRTHFGPAAAVDVQNADLLSEILAFICKSGMSKSAFGTYAIGDPAFVTDLEKGRELRSRSIYRVRSYIASGVTHEAAKAKAGAA